MKIRTFKEYVGYLKDNPKGYWFKRRLYGWGWVPVKKEGWLVVLGFIAILLLNSFYLAPNENASPSQIAVFLGITIILVAILIGICYKKGEKPRWSWGE